MQDKISELLLSKCRAGFYTGEEACVKLNELAKNIHSKILETCEEYSLTELIHEFYTIFDQACFAWFESVPLTFQLPAESSKSVRADIERTLYISRYLIETALRSGNPTGKVPDNQTFEYIGVLASNLVEMSWFSNHIFYYDKNAGFSVSQDGKLNFYPSKKHQRLEQMSTHAETVRKKIYSEFVKTRSYSNINPYLDLVVPYNERFEKTYGIELSKVVIFSDKLAKSVELKMSTEMPNELVFKLGERAGLNKEEIIKIIDLMSMAKEDLANVDWSRVFLQGSVQGLSLHPLVKPYGSNGPIIFGPGGILRFLHLLITFIQRGTIDIGIDTSKEQETKSKKFEKDVRKYLENQSFKVQHINNTPAGEIDAVAIYEKSGILWVIETKAPLFDFRLKDFYRQSEKSVIWNKKLEKKVSWVGENVGTVLDKLKYDGEVMEIRGLIITESSFCFAEGLSYDIVTFDNLPHYLKNTLSV